MTMRFRLFLASLALLSLVGLCVHRASFAADLSGSFTYPTQFEDGSALTLAQVAQVRVEYGSCSGTAFGVKAGEVVVTPPATTFVVTGLAPATYCLRAYSKTITAAGGLESAPTGVVSKVIPFPPPKPPVLGVINVVAYELNLTPNGVKLGRAVGTVPLGTECSGAAYSTNWGVFNVVPRDAVTLSKQPKSAEIVAECGVQS